MAAVDPVATMMARAAPDYRCRWAPARIEAFRQAWRRGATDRQLAARFGLTKGQVVGKRQRLKLACNLERAVRPWTRVALDSSDRQGERA